MRAPRARPVIRASRERPASRAPAPASRARRAQRWLDGRSGSGHRGQRRGGGGAGGGAAGRGGTGGGVAGRGGGAARGAERRARAASRAARARPARGAAAGARHAVRQPGHARSGGDRIGPRYYLFSTGRGVGTKTSTDLTSWQGAAARVPANPAWIAQQVPGATDLWAPDISYLRRAVSPLLFGVDVRQQPLVHRARDARRARLRQLDRSAARSSARPAAATTTGTRSIRTSIDDDGHAVARVRQLLGRHQDDRARRERRARDDTMLHSIAARQRGAARSRRRSSCALRLLLPVRCRSTAAATARTAPTTSASAARPR